jgi:hypothetical protein
MINYIKAAPTTATTTAKLVTVVDVADATAGVPDDGAVEPGSGAAVVATVSLTQEAR